MDSGWWTWRMCNSTSSHTHCAGSKFTIFAVYKGTHRQLRPQSGSNLCQHRLPCRMLTGLVKLRTKLTDLTNPIRCHHTLCHITHHLSHPNLRKLQRRTGQKIRNSSIQCEVGNGRYLPKITPFRLLFKMPSHSFFAILLRSIHSPPGQTKSSLSVTPSTKPPQLRVSTK